MKGLGNILGKINPQSLKKGKCLIMSIFTKRFKQQFLDIKFKAKRKVAQSSFTRRQHIEWLIEVSFLGLKASAAICLQNCLVLSFP